jgi:O-antigen/teichoic acid export membrane protein
VLIVRSVPSRDFGIFTLFVSFALTLCYLTSLGLPQACVYFIARGDHSPPRVVSINITLLCVTGFICCALIFVFRRVPLSTFLQDMPGAYLPWLLCLYVALLLQSVLLAYFRGVHAFGQYNLLRGLVPAGILLLLLAAAAVGELTLPVVIGVFLSVNVLGLILMGRRAARPGFHGLCFDGRAMKTFLAYGLKSHVQILAGHLMYQIDIYLIAAMLGAQQVAYYGIAVTLATIVWYVPNTAGVVLLPYLSRLGADDDVYRVSAQVSRTIVAITLLGACVAGLAGRPLMVLFYGMEYVRAFAPLLLLLPGIVMMSVYKVLTRTFSSRDRQQVSLTVAVIALLVNLGLNVLLIPRYGIEGAAVASSIAYGLAGMLLAGVLSRESGLPFRAFVLVSAADIAGWRAVARGVWERLHARGGQA